MKVAIYRVNRLLLTGEVEFICIEAVGAVIYLKGCTSGPPCQSFRMDDYIIRPIDRSTAFFKEQPHGESPVTKAAPILLTSLKLQDLVLQSFAVGPWTKEEIPQK